jgi:glycerophosphodiester phosphodiesterase
MLDRNTELVDEFFNGKLNEYTRHLTILIEKYNPSDPKTHELDPEELEDLIGTILELRSQFRKLQWYSEVNKRGFVKILKKLDKKIHINTQKKYLNSKVLVLPFANGSSVESKLSQANTFIEELSPLISGDVADSNTEKIIRSTTTSHSLSEMSISQTNGSSVSVNSDATSALRKLVLENNADAVAEFIKTNTPPKKAIVSCLYKGISNKSYECVKVLLKHVNILTDSYELNGRTIIHKLIINNARQPRNSTDKSEPPAQRNLFLNPAFSPAVSDTLSHVYGSDGVNSNDEVDALVFILESITEEQHEALVAVDEFNRTPLHYAAQYGLKLLTKVVIDYMKRWNLIDRGNGFDGPEWKDSDGVTPIQLAVAGNHPLTTKTILDSVDTSVSNLHDSSNLLAVATRLGSATLLSILLEKHSLDVNYVSNLSTNETCLYMASKHNHIDCVQILLDYGADLEIKEATYGWTPIFVASVEGNEKVCELLIKAGCDITKVDGSGWTAMEHACLRGHLKVMQLTKPPILPGVPLFFSSNNSFNMAKTTTGDISDQSPGHSPKEAFPQSEENFSKSELSLESSISNNAAVKTFGHRYLQKENSLILLNLGSMDMRETAPPIQLDRVPYSKASSTQLDTALSLVISCKNSDSEPFVIDLPITEGQAMEQIAFHIKSLENTDGPQSTTIYFDIVPTYHGNKTRILGRGVGLISDMIAGACGDKLRSLHRTITIPILETGTLDILGKLRFQFLVVNAFNHPRIGVAKSATYWKQLITTRVVGHRGLGKNSTSVKSLQLGENTLESFIQAANLGASYVEFDVQLTKDLVPVVYHDFLVSETGIDVPIQSITLEQFLSISDQQQQPTNGSNNSRRQRTSPLSSSAKGDVSGYSSDDDNGNRRKQRSKSLFSEKKGYEMSIMDERMKNTRDFKLKGFKSNIRGHSIQAPVTTLEHVFKTVPKNVGFNIECKYPMLDESQAEDMDTFAIEMNLWVDTVLKCVYDNAAGRDIIFSSFHPEIAIMLSLKQPSIPVLFLTEAGTSPMYDTRASSLQEAVRLAKRWDLLGIVSESTPLVECPRLVNVVKENGLVCVTYGTRNNDPLIAREQIEAGVDAVIVDSVLAVRKGLTEGANQK